MSMGDNAPTFCVRQILPNTAIAGRSERFSETAIKFETEVAFSRSDESETPGDTFPATSVEMNADDAGSVRPICDGSSLDKIEIVIVFPSQENPNALSLRTGFTQEFFFRDFAELKVRSFSFNPPAVFALLGLLLLRVSAIQRFCFRHA